MDSARLSRRAREIITDAMANRVFISPASYWEIAIKMSVGKFAINASYEVFWSRGIGANGSRSSRSNAATRAG